jgi:hypothetical protein
MGRCPPLAPWFLSEVVPRQIREGFLSLFLRSVSDLMPIGVMSLHFSGGIFTKLMCPQDMPGIFSEYFMCRVPCMRRRCSRKKGLPQTGSVSGNALLRRCYRSKRLTIRSSFMDGQDVLPTIADSSACIQGFKMG